MLLLLLRCDVSTTDGCGGVVDQPFVLEAGGALDFIRKFNDSGYGKGIIRIIRNILLIVYTKILQIRNADLQFRV